MSGEGEFINRLNRILEADDRFKDEAYLFVIASLGRALKRFEKPRHITGQELLAAIREEAEMQFGPMAAAVFYHWGVKNSLDFGAIVFNMVREGILLKTDDDRLEDFKDSVFFDNIFKEDLGYRLNDETCVLKNTIKNNQ